MGYIILIIICITGIVGGYFFGRYNSVQRRMANNAPVTRATNYPLATYNDYNVQTNTAYDTIQRSKYQSLPLPKPPAHIKAENEEGIYDEFYTEMNPQAKEDGISTEGDYL